jgi:hypothetical protein
MVCPEFGSRYGMALGSTHVPLPTVVSPEVRRDET